MTDSMYQLPAYKRAFWGGIADALDPPEDVYYNDPVRWAQDRLSVHPYEYQAEAMGALPTKRRVCVRGPHGLGKTGMASWLAHWFRETRERKGVDWKVVTTASVWRQLEKYLWPEIHKWAPRLPLVKGKELLTLAMNGTYGQAFPVASDDEANIEGAHATEILYIIDEGKNVPTATFDAIEGALSTGNAYVFCMSTPGAPAGRFYEIQTRKPGTEDWWVMHVTKDMAIQAGAMNEDWAEQRRKQWGENDPRYKNRVLGEFSTVDESTVIPLEWVEAANERWLAITEAIKTGEKGDLPPFDLISVDVARLGSDDTVYAYRHGWFIDELEVVSHKTTDIIADKVIRVLKTYGGRAVIDVIGVGAGVVDNARREGCVVDAFNASSRTDLLDTSGELGFVNRRAAAWWGLRELLDPDRGAPVALPPDDVLVGDLTSPKWWEVAGGRIQVEGKADIKKRIGRSPDRGDSVVMAFAIEEGEPDNQDGVYVEDFEALGFVSPF